ncbi:putative UbiX-like flavin prenyltransferase [bacterium HR39]|nr:putative UbiX-like flavin prenyltransferase [bacterium HR39]
MKRMVVGISGATGVVYGVRLLEVLRGLGIETHLVLTRPARLTIAYELERPVEEVLRLAHRVHPIHDVGSPLASGSFSCLGMVVAPCSMRTLAAIAHGLADNLLTRAADVMLKERRRLVLLVRETPLSLVHIENMAAVTRAGAIVMPPLPAFYAKPRTIGEMVDHTVGRVLDLFGLPNDLAPRWRDPEDPLS